jgi:methionyl-tRNA formyltransferase
LKIVFAGTPEFARAALEALCAAGHEVVLVLTQPDRPAGRGMQLQASPVKQYALACGIGVIQPRSLRADGRYPDEAQAAQRRLADTPHDVMVVAAYGLILPQAVLDIAPRGCLNIHASLLPRWRGAAPIHRAIAAGDAETGITIMQMDAGLDTGAMLLTRVLPIAPDDTSASLHDRLAVLGGSAIVETLTAAAAGRLVACPQPADGVTYAAKVSREDGVLDWRAPAADLERRVRAFEASACLRGTPLKIHHAAVRPVGSAATAAPGTVLASGREGILVACGADALLLDILQKPGGKRLAARDFLAGFAVPAGEQFELPVARS